MIRPLLVGAALALALVTAPAAMADGYPPADVGPRLAPHRHHAQAPWRRRQLPPDVAYRDASFGPGFVDGPPPIVEVGPPRSLALPLYNEPPPRFLEF